MTDEIVDQPAGHHSPSITVLGRDGLHTRYMAVTDDDIERSLVNKQRFLGLCSKCLCFHSCCRRQCFLEGVESRHRFCCVQKRMNGDNYIMISVVLLLLAVGIFVLTIIDIRGTQTFFPIIFFDFLNCFMVLVFGLIALLTTILRRKLLGLFLCLMLLGVANLVSSGYMILFNSFHLYHYAQRLPVNVFQLYAKHGFHHLHFRIIFVDILFNFLNMSCVIISVMCLCFTSRQICCARIRFMRDATVELDDLHAGGLAEYRDYLSIPGTAMTFPLVRQARHHRPTVNQTSRSCSRRRRSRSTRYINNCGTRTVESSNLLLSIPLQLETNQSAPPTNNPRFSLPEDCAESRLNSRSLVVLLPSPLRSNVDFAFPPFPPAYSEVTLTDSNALSNEVNRSDTVVGPSTDSRLRNPEIGCGYVYPNQIRAFDTNLTSFSR